MPINPNVPGDNDYIASFPAQNRANMQAIDDALQDLTTTTNDLATKINPLHAEAAALLALAGQFTAILDSAVVDHNLDVSNPANGYYVRWENGLQLCFLSGYVTDYPFDSEPPDTSGTNFTRYTYYYDWNPPGEFIATPNYADMTIGEAGLWEHDFYHFHGVMNTNYVASRSSPTRLVFKMSFIKTPADEAISWIRDTSFFAIGRWK